ncbi:hypothetical protein I9W82_001799 [Candida metapsilosis]|uniref:Uncharacterized protein n=1 Tax=Candida metapsilosis TaxID=273372 RepID=A0A8H7ZG42_9ASCO|nr:hypothetical protein I9W82_001799 [Candida metapsilosis]
MDLPLEIQMRLLYMVPQSNLKYINSHYYILYNDLFYHKIVAIFGDDTINVIIKVLPWLKPYIKSLDSFRYVNRKIIAKRLKLIDNLNKEDEYVSMNSDNLISFRAITTNPTQVESLRQEFGDRYDESATAEKEEDTQLQTYNPLNVQYVKDSWKYIYSILKNKRLYAEYSDYKIDEPKNYVFNHFVEINHTYLLSYSKDVWLAPGQYNLNIGLAVKHGHGLGTTKFEIKYDVYDEEDEEVEHELKAEAQFEDLDEADEDAMEQDAEGVVEMDGVRATSGHNRNSINNHTSNEGSSTLGSRIIRPSGIVNGGGVDRSVSGSMDHTVDANANGHPSIENNTAATSPNTTVTKSFYPPTNINDILPKNQFCFLRVAQFTIPPKENQRTKRNKLRRVTIKMEEIGLYLKSGFRIYFIDISQPSLLYDEYDLLYYSMKQTEYKYFINILLKNLYKALNYVQNGGGDENGNCHGRYGTGDPYDLWHEFDKSFLKEYNEEIVNDSNSSWAFKEGDAAKGEFGSGTNFQNYHKRSFSALSGSVSAASSYSSLNSLYSAFKYDLRKLNNYANFYFKNLTSTKRFYKFSTIYQQRQFINRFGDYTLDWKEYSSRPPQPSREPSQGVLSKEKQVLSTLQESRESVNDKYDGDADAENRSVPESKCSYDKLGLKWKIPIVGEL